MSPLGRRLTVIETGIPARPDPHRAEVEQWLIAERLAPSSLSNDELDTLEAVASRWPDAVPVSAAVLRAAVGRG